MLLKFDDLSSILGELWWATPNGVDWDQDVKHSWSRAEENLSAQNGHRQDWQSRQALMVAVETVWKLKEEGTAGHADQECRSWPSNQLRKSFKGGNNHHR